MLEQVLTYLHNWFTEDANGNPYRRWSGKFVICDGRVNLPLMRGQHFRIVGSRFNDGLWDYPTNNLHDEVFEGVVLECVIPKDVVDIADEVEAWEQAHGEEALSPYTSESFGGYSYTKADGAPSTWQDTFSRRLSAWKKVS